LEGGTELRHHQFFLLEQEKDATPDRIGQGGEVIE
jgi:hypothetical protein